MIPKTQKQWLVRGDKGFDYLEFQAEALIPSIGDRDVLVKSKGINFAASRSLNSTDADQMPLVHAVSLNSRDLLILKGLYPFPLKDSHVHLSDGAGVVAAVGSRVHRFRVGDRVATLSHQDHLAGPLDAKSRTSALGSSLDVVLREYGVFTEHGLVNVPENLSLLEASSLPSAALTAWNALYGLEGMVSRQCDTVLTEGTGGVSIFAMQFAKSAGAKVIATTSTAQRAERLKELGADYWGEPAKNSTPNKERVSAVVEVGGPASLRQALTALKFDGSISMVGSVGGFVDPGSNTEEPTFFDTVIHSCTLRGTAVGSRLQFEDMNRAIAVNDLHPVLDRQILKLEEAREAYQYIWDQKHFGKVILEIV
ncbi:hypothetical protein AFLA70_18g005621 [Aspergillus flavus AF70]|nr:hypothetical protein AFLA70_18g005621 [Aspergillus flavus AF70]